MDPITVRDLAPRMALGLVIALAAAAGAYALNHFDGEIASKGFTAGIAGSEM